MGCTSYCCLPRPLLLCAPGGGGGGGGGPPPQKVQVTFKADALGLGKVLCLLVFQQSLWNIITSKTFVCASAAAVRCTASCDCRVAARCAWVLPASYSLYVRNLATHLEVLAFELMWRGLALLPAEWNDRRVLAWQDSPGGLQQQQQKALHPRHARAHLRTP